MNKPMTNLAPFTLSELRNRAKWLEKAAKVREGEAASYLIAQRDQVLNEITRRTSKGS